eukprot:scaffold58817_cov70-Phaeocystis_antarctica.AAC.5
MAASPPAPCRRCPWRCRAHASRPAGKSATSSEYSLPHTTRDRRGGLRCGLRGRAEASRRHSRATGRGPPLVVWFVRRTVARLVHLTLLAHAVLLAPGSRVTAGERRVPAQELVAGGHLERACGGCGAPLLHPLATARVVAPVVEARAVVRGVELLNLVQEGESLLGEHVPASDEVHARQADQACK